MSSATYRCGHPRTAENTRKIGSGRTGCATCKKLHGLRSRQRIRGDAKTELERLIFNKEMDLPRELLPAIRDQLNWIGTSVVRITFVDGKARHELVDPQDFRSEP